MNKLQKWGIFGLVVGGTSVLAIYGVSFSGLILFNLGIIGTCFLLWMMD